MSIFRRKKEFNPLIAMVTGMEHTGTTILSQLIASHPDINCGFECGLLLGDAPSDFLNIMPWSKWMQQQIESEIWGQAGWGIKPEDMQKICKADSWIEAYRQIMKYSPIFTNERYILDKTPRYVYKLYEIMEKVPDVPCIVLYKKPVKLLASVRKRHTDVFEKLPKYTRAYKEFITSVMRCKEDFPNRLLIYDYENLKKNPQFILKQIFAKLGIKGKAVEKIICGKHTYNNNNMYLSLLEHNDSEEKIFTENEIEFIEKSIPYVNLCMSTEDASINSFSLQLRKCITLAKTLWHRFTKAVK